MSTSAIHAVTVSTPTICIHIIMVAMCPIAGKGFSGQKHRRQTILKDLQTTSKNKTKTSLFYVKSVHCCRM